MAALNREKEACQQIVSRQGLGLASTGDAAAELRASLNLQATRNRYAAVIPGESKRRTRINPQRQ